MAAIKLTNVKKIYDKKVTAVHDFNLDVADKEFIVFVGPSGCGKSTTLRMIAGLEEISEGTCEIDGKIVNDLPPKDRNIAMVFQNYALYPHLSVFENIAFPLRLLRQEVEVTDPKTGKVKKVVKKMDNDEIFAKVTSVAETLGITEYLTRKPRALSGGQRQRVAIGRAMVRDSKVLLMDEPLSNLDAKLRNQMRAEIILLRKKIDATFIYVTHDQTEAMTLGDRIVIMKDGFIQQIGTPQQVFDTPANLFVAGFIGAPQMNFFEGAKLTNKGGKHFVEIHGVEFPVDGKNGDILTAKGIEDKEVILGVRPEHMSFSIKPGKASLPCELVVSEMMGSELHLHLTAPDGSKIITRVQTMNLTDEERAAIVPGNTVYVSFESKAMHMFDPESDTRTSVLHPENEYIVHD